jgi:hypothetical protein
MATLYISEFSNLPFVSNGVIQAPAAHEWVTDQTVPIGVSSSRQSVICAQSSFLIHVT